MCVARAETTSINFIVKENVFHHTNKFPAGNYKFKFNNINTRTRYEMCSKLTACSSVSVVNFEQVNTN